MKRLIALMILSLAAVTYGQSSDLVYKDDVTQYVSKNGHRDDFHVVLTLGADAMVLAKNAIATVRIPYASISGITYDRRSRVRKMAPSYGKRIQHFLTVQYKDEQGVGQYVEFEVGKDLAPEVVASLEARTGRKVERTGDS